MNHSSSNGDNSAINTWNKFTVVYQEFGITSLDWALWLSATERQKVQAIALCNITHYA